jgi:hypothetical protein
MAGYSDTPLVKKLGIKQGFLLKAVNPPAHYFNLLAPLPKSSQFTEAEKGVDFIHAFFVKEKQLRELLPTLRKQVKKDGMIWISWPKKASQVPSELDEDKIRDYALGLGLVDVKVCAVDDIWSGLKLVHRVKSR